MKWILAAALALAMTGAAHTEPIRLPSNFPRAAVRDYCAAAVDLEVDDLRREWPQWRRGAGRMAMRPGRCLWLPGWGGWHQLLVGLDTPEEADKWVGSCEGRLARPLTDDELQGNGFSVLAGLGVFGPEAARGRPRRFKADTA